MLGKHDHIAYVARELDATVAMIAATFGLEVTRAYELPEFSVRGVFLGDGAALVEVVEIVAPALAESRLAGLDARLDHVAYEVTDLDRTAARLRRLGTRFCGPDGIEVDSPIELGDSRHLWTLPASGPVGFNLQLVERAT